ncbi:DUF4286 family protein [Zavarzinia compransoris]|uniref:EthD domain-containing protein n=1 Tax=Zavarzinia compransoris TaxID=1264899 RepID=A0A317ED73_9PROT|nr:DUF4286 family protein [Zavarzinia compransoris]PWR23303.1 hypothetical protein DKG75_01670 [Zavarzinia compransoris]TDP46126.1 hypothetical protein DES42_104212 [Zavarzinia compransoris]
MARHVQIVLSNPASIDRDREFNDWYGRQHIPDLMRLPGFKAAQRYRVALPFAGAVPWSHAVLYELECDDLGAMLAELVDAHGDGRIAVSDVLDTATLTALVFSPLGPHQGVKGRRRQVFAALSKPAAGREADFNAWYDGRHVPDVIRVPGIFGAGRYRLSTTFLDPLGQDQSYLALYDVDSEDLRALAAQLRADVRSERTQMSDAIDTGALTAFFLEPVGPVFIR